MFEQTGGFDERLFMYGEDMEWYQRIRDVGEPIRFFPQAEIVQSRYSSAQMRYGDKGDECGGIRLLAPLRSTIDLAEDPGYGPVAGGGSLDDDLAVPNLRDTVARCRGAGFVSDRGGGMPRLRARLSEISADH